MASEPSFPRFSHFPPEIRTMIWRFSIPDPRIVPIRYQASTTAYIPRKQPPAILQTTRESRHEGLKVYHELKLGPFPNSGCYVDLSRDTVYLKTHLTRKTNNINVPEHIDPFESAQSQRRLYGVHPLAAHFFSGPTMQPGSNPFRHQHEVARAQRLPSRSHTKIILSDLFSSEDGLLIFTRFHVDHRTWHLMRNYIRYYRHDIPIHPERLCLVWERGDGFLPKDVVLSSPVFVEGRPADSPAKLASTFIAGNRFLNRIDEFCWWWGVCIPGIKPSR